VARILADAEADWLAEPDPKPADADAVAAWVIERAPA